MTTKINVTGGRVFYVEPVPADAKISNHEVKMLFTDKYGSLYVGEDHMHVATVQGSISLSDLRELIVSLKSEIKMVNHAGFNPHISEKFLDYFEAKYADLLKLEE